MLRMSKLTDYGTVVLAYMAERHPTVHSAAEVAQQTRLALPTVSKLLKAMARSGLVTSQRGSHGGYSLARAADQISAAQIIDALEGPVAITECATEHSQCGLESMCRVSHAWQGINGAIRRALGEITLAELLKPRGGGHPGIRLRPHLSPTNDI